MLYSVLIVDDEKIIREGIANALPWEELGFFVEDLVDNGFTALEKLREKPSDIAIIDVKMPVMNGLELVEKAREEGIPTEFIIMSGYDDFEYANKAMLYGVKYFLLKPTDPDEIISALQGTKELICQKRESLLLLDKYNESHIKLKKLMKEQFLRDCILGRNYSSEERDYYAKFFDIEGREFSAIAVRASRDEEAGDIFWVRSIAEEFFAGKLFLCTIVHDLLYFVIERISNEELFACTQKLVENIKSYGFKNITATFSHEWNILDSAQNNNDLEMCIHFRFWVPDAEIITIDDVDFDKSNTQSVSFDSQILVNCLRCGDYDNAKAEVDMFFKLLQEKKTNIEFAKTNVILLCINLINIDNSGTEEYMGVINDIHKIETLTEIQSYIILLIKNLAEKNLSRIKKKSNKKIDRMLECIEENISKEEFSLKWMSENLLYFNTDYLGKLFKKEKGISFTNYVIQRRIEIACKLLDENPQLKIYELAEKTGFGDNPRYFSQVFRKVMGVSPLDYRKTL